MKGFIVFAYFAYCFGIFPHTGRILTYIHAILYSDQDRFILERDAEICTQHSALRSEHSALRVPYFANLFPIENLLDRNPMRNPHAKRGILNVECGTCTQAQVIKITMAPHSAELG